MSSMRSVDEKDVRNQPEEATAKAAAGWRQRRKGWRLTNGLYLAGHGDIDHILVGPGGVFVIESKWTTNRCRIEFGEIVGLLGRVPVAQASDGALKVERLLRHGPQRFDLTVKPVVVIWGPGRSGSEEIESMPMTKADARAKAERCFGPDVITETTKNGIS